METSTVTRRIISVYLVIMAAIAFLLELIDLEFLGQFNARLNHLLIEWLDTPGMVLEMTWEMFAVIPTLIGWVALVVLFGFALRWVTNRIFQGKTRGLSLKRFAVIYPLILGLVFLTIRGRVAIKAPLTWGVAYFSEYNFANLLALNSCFTFVQDAIIESGKRKRDAAPYRGISPDEAYSTVRNLLKIDDRKLISGYPLARKEGDDDVSVRGDSLPRNVMIVMMESLSAKYVGCTGGVRSLAPEIDRIAQDGLLFTRFYTNGGHTFSGIFSTTTGLPVLPGRSLMKRGEGQQEFSGLATTLKKRGYQTFFYVPHDLHFDNMQGFLVANGFDNMIGQEAYSAGEVLSSLGVPDEVMFDKILEDMKGMQQPFMTLAMTASHHGPFIVPDRLYPHIDPSEPQYKRFNAFSYADWAFGRFYDQLRETEWGRRTVLVILGDTGFVTDLSRELDLALFHTPLLLIDKDVIEPGVSDRVGGQKDIVATIMDVLGGSWINNTMGRSLMCDKPEHALFVSGPMTGFIFKDHFLLVGRNGKSSLYALNDMSKPLVNDKLLKDMVSYSKALMTSTHFLIRSRLVGLPELIP